MKKRLIAVVAAVFAAMLLWSGASTGTQAFNGNEWDSRPHHHRVVAGNDWDFAPDSAQGNGQGFARSAFGNDWD